MTDQKDSDTQRDMLDIIFANRNKAYGAYFLRRSYKKFLAQAFVSTLLLIGVFFALPVILDAVQEFVPQEKPVAVVAELGPPPDIDANTPPPPPPPPPPTPPPPPPTRSTVKFVPPVVKKDTEVQEIEQKSVAELIEVKEDIGKENKKGNDEAPPSIVNTPSELKIIEVPKGVVEEKTYESFDIQKPPSFPGGEAELFNYLQKNINYPVLAKENNITGVVPLSFVINKDGSVSDVQILRDIGGGCGKEAVRVVKAMPKWSPGEANGHAVKVRYTLPVRFQLE